MKTLIKLVAVIVLVFVAYEGAFVWYITQPLATIEKIDEWCPLFRWMRDVQ